MEDFEKLSTYCQEAANQHTNLIESFFSYSITAFKFYAERPLIARIIYLNIPSVYWVDQSSLARERIANQLLKLVNIMQNRNMLRKDVPAY